MRATRRSAASAARRSAARKAAVKSRALAKRPVKSAGHGAHPAPQSVLFRVCKSGWGVVVEKTPNALGTRFVCPFCPESHRVPGPVRGFRKVRRAQWIKLRRVGE